MALPNAFPDEKPRAVTWRSVLLGLLGTVLICGLTAYNDYALNNTPLVGNFLPVGLVIFVLVLVLLINAPLRRWLPARALRDAELAVTIGMLLAACSLPSSGLMRYLPAGIVGSYTIATERRDVDAALAQTGLPRWLLPDVPATQPADIGNSEVFVNYRLRSPDGTVPWGAWIRPLAMWGIFAALMWGLMAFVSLIVRRQWAENERLSFPLATIYSSLIESPEPGHALNSLFRSRSFWLVAITVFCYQAIIGLHAYFPSIPELPRGYDFFAMLTERPWVYMTPDFKVAEIYFCVIGITFFLQTRVAFSLFFFVILQQIMQMSLESAQVVVSEPMKADQTFGGLVVMTGVVLYIGRAHWWMVIRHMFGRARADETESRYLPHAFAGWGAAFCFTGVVIFMVMMGASVIGAIFVTLSLLMLLMVIARIVAETGMVFVQSNWLANRLWLYPLLIPETPIKTTPGTFFVASHFTHLFHDLRESFAAFFQQGVRVADTVAYERSHRWRTGVSFLLAIALALIVGYCVSAAGMLWTEYHYANSMLTHPPDDKPLNYYATDYSLRNKAIDPLVNYPNNVHETHSLGLNIGIGAAIVGICSTLWLTVSWWPLHPVGFIVLYSWALQKTWLSIFIGWVAKVIIIRVGGASMLRAARNIFIGLVVGDMTAAGCWLIVSVVANTLGYDYHKITLLPV